jgi:hypothetical protein
LLYSANSAAIFRRKQIYETLHPETVNGENQHTRVRQIGEGSPADRFTASIAGPSSRRRGEIIAASARPATAA